MRPAGTTHAAEVERHDRLALFFVLRHALPMLLASEPRPAHRAFDEWVECVETFAAMNMAPARERLAALFPP